MSNGIWLGTSGAAGALRALDVMANNLANAQTTGFKADRVVFSVEEATTTPPKESPSAVLLDTVSTRVEIGATDFRSGGSIPTDSPTDFALEGEGFFWVRDEGGQEYLTRDGSFRLDAEGRLATRSGALVLNDSGGSIAVAGTGLEVKPDGTVLVGDADRGAIAVRDVADRSTLTKVAGTRFTFEEGSLIDGTAEVAQGRLEGSNVEPVGALVELIALQRYYEAFQKTAQASNDMDQQLAQRVGRKND